ncbi:SAYSvFN domain-containing protein 1-like [Apostichopus japonicus]|uniref:SAYSvFN domain-containing protein 1-like n=1 Tax=Stichopus japonicus TaxID=307972 RepID=UPI003AB84A36
MEAQLAAYRARKAKEKAAAAQGSWLSAFRRRPASQTSKVNRSFPERLDNTASTESDDEGHKVHPEMDCLNADQSYFSVDRLLKLLLWLCLLGAFVFLGLGGVFILVSIFVVIYLSMGSKKREKGELSAYSVFNPNCERLQGQLTAEQFERELKYGSGGM